MARLRLLGAVSDRRSVEGMFRRGLKNLCLIPLLLVPLRGATAQQPPIAPLRSAGELCGPAPEQRVTLAGPDAADRLAGTYTLIVVDGARRVATGRLRLLPTDSAHRHTRIPDWIFPLHGASDVDLYTFGRVSLLYSPAALDADRPGVQTIYDLRDRSVTLVFGSAFSDSGGAADAGVSFAVTAVDSAGFAGRWQDDGLVPEGLGGYFCARRVHRPPN